MTCHARMNLRIMKCTIFRNNMLSRGRLCVDAWSGVVPGNSTETRCRNSGKSTTSAVTAHLNESCKSTILRLAKHHVSTRGL